MTDDLKNFEKAPEADTPQTEDPTTLEMPTDDLEADIEPGKPDDDFEREGQHFLPRCQLRL